MKKNRIGLHIIFWLAYFLFEVYVELIWIMGATSYKDYPLARQLFMSSGYVGTIFLVKVPLTYFFLYLIDRASNIKRIWVLISLAVISLVAATVAHRLLTTKVVLTYIYKDPANAAMVFDIRRLIYAGIDLVFIIGVAVAIKQYRLHRKSVEREKGLVKEKMEAELKFLRNQTNPHFLFNTLNNIYALARKKSDQTADVVMKLSKLLRFMLYESHRNSITIAEELRVLSDYIELEKIRYNERLTVGFTRTIDNEIQPIAPLILLPFVENAFKHGASEARFNSFIYIDVQLEKGQLIFKIENSKDDDGEKKMMENIGLTNVRRQLELMYPEHCLTIENEINLFKITLTVNLLKYATVQLPHR
jgi:CRISPR/Cas system CSM-associated protein Csm2 small subunit